MNKDASLLLKRYFETYIHTPLGRGPLVHARLDATKNRSDAARLKKTLAEVNIEAIPLNHKVQQRDEADEHWGLRVSYVPEKADNKGRDTGLELEILELLYAYADEKAQHTNLNMLENPPIVRNEVDFVPVEKAIDKAPEKTDRPR